MNIQWYPGHMTRTRRQMAVSLKQVDAVCEVVDARIPQVSRNPDMDEIAGSKPRILILNRTDLADPEATKQWAAFYRSKGYAVLTTDAKSGAGVAKFSAAVRTLLADKIEKWKEKGQTGRSVKVMVVGIPNVGKSTFINKVLGRKSAKAADKPGVTRGQQWFRVEGGLELLDTPGILWPKFEDQKIGEHLALIGSINDEILHVDELAVALIRNLKNSYLDLLEKRYDITIDEDAYDTLKKIAIARKCLQKGELPDVDRASSMLLEDFRSGKLGRITLERPEEWQ